MKKKLTLYIIRQDHIFLILGWLLMLVAIIISILLGNEDIFIGNTYAAGPEEQNDQDNDQDKNQDRDKGKSEKSKGKLPMKEVLDPSGNTSTSNFPSQTSEFFGKEERKVREDFLMTLEDHGLKHPIDPKEKERTERFFKKEQEKWDLLQTEGSTTPESLSSYSVLSSDIHSDDSEDTKQKKRAVKEEEAILKKEQETLEEEQEVLEEEGVPGPSKRVRFSRDDEYIPRNFKKK